MSVQYTCNWCGMPVDGDRCGNIAPGGQHEDHGLVWLGKLHFHAGRLRDSDSCLRRAWRLLEEHRGSMLRPIAPEEQERAAERAGREAFFEACRRWERLSWDERASRVLQALGDERLTGRELAARIRENENDQLVPNSTEIRAAAVRMVAAGVLDQELVESGRRRYCYSRRRELSGEIAELERAFREAA